MVSARLSNRFVGGFLLLFVPPTVVAAGILLLLYSLGVHHHPAALVASLLVGSAVMVAYLAFMVHGMVESLIATLHEIQLDCETTGFDHDSRARIVSIAGVRIHGGSVQREDVFDTLVNPRCSIPPTSSALHGVTHAMVGEALDAVAHLQSAAIS